MIRLYGLDEWYAKAPKDLLIENVDEYFDLIVKLPDTYKVRQILKYIDQAEYLDSKRITDRFGVGLYSSELSTGSKCVLTAYLNKDKIINFIEAGVNAYEALVLFDIDCTILVPQVDWFHYIYNTTDKKLPYELNIEVVGNQVYHNIDDYCKEVGE